MLNFFMCTVNRYIDELLTPTCIRSPFVLYKTLCSNIKFLQNYFVKTLDILEVLGGIRRVLVPELCFRSGVEFCSYFSLSSFDELVCRDICGPYYKEKIRPCLRVSVFV